MLVSGLENASHIGAVAAGVLAGAMLLGANAGSAHLASKAGSKIVGFALVYGGFYVRLMIAAAFLAAVRALFPQLLVAFGVSMLAAIVLAGNFRLALHAFGAKRARVRKEA